MERIFIENTKSFETKILESLAKRGLMGVGEVPRDIIQEWSIEYNTDTSAGHPKKLG